MIMFSTLLAPAVVVMMLMIIHGPLAVDLCVYCSYACDSDAASMDLMDRQDKSRTN